MTYDATQPPPAETYRIALCGVHGIGAAASLYDPHEDRTVATSGLVRTTDRIELSVPLTDHPRLLMISE